VNEVVDDPMAYDAAVIEVVDDGDGSDGLQQPPPFSPPPGQKRNLCLVAVSMAVLKMLKKEVT